VSPSDTERETMEIAALEIARMSEEIDGLRAELLSSQEARMELEAHLESFQKKMQSELAKWKAIWAQESERSEVHMDRKLEIYTRSIDCADEGEDKENQHVNLEAENERLRREVEILRRDAVARSPSKSQRMPLRESRIGREGGREVVDVGREMDRMKIGGDSVLKGGVSVASSPTKKARKLTARKWDLMDEGEML